MSSHGSTDSGPRPVSRRVDVVLVVLFCLLAFTGAAWVSDSVFERLPHTEDESAFLFQAQTIASGRLIADSPKRPEFFSIPFIIIRDGMWFGKYPPGFPLVLAAGVVVGHAWLVNATFAALCVLMVYLFARRLYGRATALLAAALLMVSPFFLLQAGSLLSHIVALFWTLLFLALFPLVRTQRSVALAACAGAAIGMLFLSRPLTAVGIASPYVIWTLLTIVRRHRIQRTFVITGSTALVFVLGFLAYNEITTGSPLHTAYELWWPFDRIGFGADRGLNGHDLDDAIRNTRVNTNSLAAYLFGWPGRFSLVPAIAAVIVSALMIARRPYRRERAALQNHITDGPSAEMWDLILASVVVSLIAVHMLYWTPGQMYGPRYYMEAIGPLVILTARCFVRLSAAVAVVVHHLRPDMSRPRDWGAAAIGSLIVALSLYAHLNWAPDTFDRFRAWNDITATDVATVESHQLDNALVFIERQSWTDYAPFFAQNTPSLDSTVVYASDRGERENRALIELYPGRTYYRFANGQLTVLAP